MKYLKQIRESKNMGALFDIAKDITDKEEAKRFFSSYIKFIMDANQNADIKEATDIAHSNLGYFAGYYDNDMRKHIKEMYGSSHPVFGDIEPTMEEAFEAGKKLGTKFKSAKP